MSYDTLFILLLIVLTLNAYASRIIFLDESPATSKFWLQMGLVWLLPLLGAVLLIFVKGMQDARPAVSPEAAMPEYGYPGQEGSIPNHGCGPSTDGGGDGGGGGGGGD